MIQKQNSKQYRPAKAESAYTCTKQTKAKQRLNRDSVLEKGTERRLLSWLTRGNLSAENNNIELTRTRNATSRPHSRMPMDYTHGRCERSGGQTSTREVGRAPRLATAAHGKCNCQYVSELPRLVATRSKVPLRRLVPCLDSRTLHTCRQHA